MAVKFPLEVRNGVKARNIFELKENFDIEKIIGYFLDGKLKNWLDARYYEEEAEAIEQLDENDTALAKKLCEIFAVEYEMEEINHEEIARRNERLAKLKQFTADIDVISNIDFVAFNQEELADLYDLDVKKIYLCEGKFVIPKSKKDLEYCLVGMPNIIGLDTEKMETNEQTEKEYTEQTFAANTFKESLPITVADKIHHEGYVVLKDYVVLTSWKNKVTCINKTTGEAFVLCEERGTGRVALKDNTIWYTHGDKNIIHNLDTDEKIILETSLTFPFNYSRSGSKILFNNENYILQLLDVDTFQMTSIFRDGDISNPIKSEHFVLRKERIYYIPKLEFNFFHRKSENAEDANGLYSYEFRSCHSEKICNIVDEKSKLYIHGLIYEDDSFYLIATNSTLGAGNNDISIIQYSETNGKKRIFSDKMKEGRLCYSYPYVIYVPESSLFPVNMYNIKTNVSMQVAKGCGEAYSGCYYINRFSIVDHWLYFNKKDQMMYRIDLENPVSEIKIGSDLKK